MRFFSESFMHVTGLDLLAVGAQVARHRRVLIRANETEQRPCHVLMMLLEDASRWPQDICTLFPRLKCTIRDATTSVVGSNDLSSKLFSRVRWTARERELLAGSDMMAFYSEQEKAGFLGDGRASSSVSKP